MGRQARVSIVAATLLGALAVSGQALAAVSSAVSAGVLTITSDAAGDAIAVTCAGPGSVAKVNGVDATGSPVCGTLSGLSIAAGDGNDTITLSDRGNFTNVANALVDGGAGVDSLTVNGTPGEDTAWLAAFGAALGAQGVSLVGGTGGLESLAFNGGGGADRITIEGGLWQVDGGGGDDVYTIVFGSLGSGTAAIADTSGTGDALNYEDCAAVVSGSWTLTKGAQSLTATGIDSAPLCTGAWVACGGAVTQRCVSTFELAGGGAVPAQVSLDARTSSGVEVSLQLKVPSLPPGLGQYELSPYLTPSSSLHIRVNTGAIDPGILTATGAITSVATTYDAVNGNVLDLVVSPRPSSWTTSPCSIASCAGSATIDYAAFLLVFSGLPQVPPGLPPAVAAQITSFVTAMRGGYIGTNAQAFTSPDYDPAQQRFSFTLAAPHLKADASLNPGFVTAFLPNAMLTDIWGLAPASVGSGSFNVVKTDGSSESVAVTVAVTGAGVRIDIPLGAFHYSTPAFSIGKATVPDAPTGVQATAGNGEATVTFQAPAITGGAAIASYTVTASPGGQTATGSGGPITVKGLANGTTYTFTVTATNAVGKGAASAPSNAVTPVAPPPQPQAPQPQPPQPEPPRPPAIAVIEQSGSTTKATIAAGRAASLSLAPLSGGAAPTLVWTAGTFASNVSVTAVAAHPASVALAGFSAGSAAVELSFSSGGGAVHAFPTPLEIVFPGAAPDLNPGHSSDGATWTAIPLLAGTTLPAGQQDGYYRDSAGAVHVLTLHASYFGVLGPLVLHSGNRPVFPVRSKNVFVFLAPERKASATVQLLTRSGATLRTLRLTLPAARTTRLKIPLPRGLRAGLYLVKVEATSGPSAVRTTLLVRLGRK